MSTIASRRMFRASIAGATIACAACGVTPLGDGDGGDEVPVAVQAAFDRSCAFAGCHAGASPAAGLSLEPGKSGEIVDGGSAGSALPMVKLGDVPGSYLAVKLLPESILSTLGIDRAGAKMPLGVDPFPEDSATIIYWIAGGDVGGFGGDETGDPGPSCFGLAPDPATPVSLAEHVFPIFEARCGEAACHGSPAGGAPMDWTDAAGAHAALVGQPSDSHMTMQRVVVGDPTTSFLWHKIAGTHEVVMGQGDPMPATGGPLCGDDALLIHEWILDGAMP